MRLKHLYIILVLLSLSFAAEAQKKGRKATPKKSPAKKEIVKKTAAKKQAPKTKQQPGKAPALKRDTTLKGATIEIIQSYKPEVKQAPKPEFTASVPPPDTSHPVFNYEVPSQTLNYTYYSQPLRPLALGRDSSVIPFYNYIKLGGGNLSTLFADAAIGSLRGENYESAIHLHHLSQNGNITDQKVALTGLEADGNLHTAKNVWHADLGVLHNTYYYYGYDQTKYSFNSGAIKQAFTGLKVGLDMKKEETMIRELGYHPAFNISLYSDNYATTERTIDFNAPIDYALDSSLRLGIGVNGSMTQYNSKLANQTNNVLQVTPAVYFAKGGLSGKAGLYPTFGKNNTYLLPDIEAKYKIGESQVNLFLGWQGLLKKNTLEELSTRNPYINTSFTVQQTHTDEIFGGIQGNVGSHISLSGRVSWWQYQNLPLFINDTATDEKQFLIATDPKVNALSLQGMIRYQVANILSVGFNATLTSFSNNAYKHVWHEPTVKLGADLLVKPFPALTITAYLSVLDGMYAVEKGNLSHKLSTIFDLGGNAEYLIIPRLSAFIQVNNLLNNKYQRWNGYEAYGLNIYGGIRFKF